MITKCPVCESNRLKNVFFHERLPKYNLSYCDTLEAALSVDIESVSFMQCLVCEFLFNSSYTQLEYDVFYDSTRASQYWITHQESIIDYLISKLIPIAGNNLSDRVVVEVGAGDFEFAQALSSHFHKVFAYEPKKSFIDVSSGNLTCINSTYPPKNINEKAEPYLVVCRHTLEHISNVKWFIEILTTERPEFLFIEVPCKSFVMSGNWHYFSYEHCSYFDVKSLTYLANQVGYDIYEYKYDFGSENLLAIFRRAKDKNVLTNYEDAILGANLQIDFEIFKRTLLEKIADDSIIFGAGGKGVMLLNLLKISNLQMPNIIDSNNKIEGRFIPLTGNKIQAPDYLGQFKGQKVFYLNNLYSSEIISQISSINPNLQVEYLFKDLFNT